MTRNRLASFAGLIALSALLPAPASAAEPSTATRCYSDVRLVPETGDVVGSRLLLRVTGDRAEGTLEFFQGNPVPVRAALVGTIKTGRVTLSASESEAHVPFTISGLSSKRRFRGTIAFNRGTLTETDSLVLLSVPVKECGSASPP